MPNVAVQRAAAPSGPLLAALALALVLAGCATRSPAPAPSTPTPRNYDRDGALPNPPAELSKTPDAEPRVEPIRAGGANKPYEVMGRTYTPVTRDVPMKESGLASWYGRKFHGKRTASGEVYDMYAMSAAHTTMPLPSYARVRNPANGREVIVRVNDRGPFHGGRIIDLSYTAAMKLDLLRGVGRVEVERLTADEIRSGAWRRGAPDDTRMAQAPSPVPAPAPIPAPAPASMEGSPASMAALDLPPLDNVRPLASAPRGYWIQLGAFRDRSGAQTFQQHVTDELDWLAPQIAVYSDVSLFKLQAGPYATREEADDAAQRVRDALQLVPVVVKR